MVISSSERFKVRVIVSMQGSWSMWSNIHDQVQVFKKGQDMVRTLVIKVSFQVNFKVNLRSLQGDNHQDNQCMKDKTGVK